VCLVVFFSLSVGKNVIAFIISHHEFLGWAIGILVPAYCALYYQNRSFYLWMQRNFFLPFRVTHSEWSYLISFTTPSQESFNKAKEFLSDKFKGDIKITQDSLNSFKFILADKTPFSLDLHPVEGGKHFFLTLKSSSYLVPSYEYNSAITEMCSLITDLDKSVKNKESSEYSVTINFQNKNPYFGFLLQSLPQDYIKDFRLSITVPTRNNTHIVADKNNLTVNADNVIQLERTIVDYLSFSPNFAK